MSTLRFRQSYETLGYFERQALPPIKDVFIGLRIIVVVYATSVRKN